MLDVAECMLASGLRREESRGAHQRTDFPARDDERFLAHHLVAPRRRRDAAGRAPAGDDHPLAPGRAGLREVSAWRDSITAAGDAVPARQGHEPPGWQEYDVPLRKEWTVLDGLNHIKDERRHRRWPSAGRAGWASAAAAA